MKTRKRSTFSRLVGALQQERKQSRGTTALCLRGLFATVLSVFQITFLYVDIPTWGGGITRGFSYGTDVKGVRNAVCLLIGPAHHRISLRAYPKKRNMRNVFIDKREGRSLPEHLVCCCSKELALPHSCCSHDALRPRLPGTSPAGCATSVRNTFYIDINLYSDKIMISCFKETFPGHFTIAVSNPQHL